MSDLENSDTSFGTVSEEDVSSHSEEEWEGFGEVATALEPYQDEPLASSSNEEIEDDEADIDGIPLEALEARFEKRQTVEEW